MTQTRSCRLCGAPLTETFVDLGMSPPCESYLDEDQLDQGETFYPLHVRICSQCLLVQLPAYIPPEDIFVHYAYFSSYSDSWVRHAETFVDQAIDRLSLDEASFVVEVASNDGYLLQHTVARGIRSLGIEPATNVAEAAVARGVPTEVMFLSEDSGAKVAAE
ncbi:MAG: SAM-dependent methyltransferase, partial [Nocardioides sp.]|nr:SAM-dependent methyltransferase [Nocardioides sp.]